MAKKALVVGGTGPTGPLIIDGLRERGYETTMLNRGSQSLPELADVPLIKADPHFAETFAEALAGQKFDVVVATYGRLRVMIDTLRDVTDRVVTVGGTAYADRGGRAASESSPRYTENKIVAKIVETEETLLAAHERGDFNWSHLRYPNLWGSRQLAPREWSILRRIRDGRRIIPVADGGLTLESKAFVENAAYAVLLTVDKPDESAGQQYNVCDDETPSDATRVRDLAAAAGVPDIELLKLPEAATGPASFWGIGRDLSFSREGRPPRTIHKLMDNSKIKRDLGYADLVPYPEAVRRTVEWYTEHPLEEGGRDEGQLSDPFNYAAEDAYKAALDAFVEATTQIPFEGVEYIHQYSHPKEPQKA